MTAAVRALCRDCGGQGGRRPGVVCACCNDSGFDPYPGGIRAELADARAIVAALAACDARDEHGYCPLCSHRDHAPTCLVARAKALR